MNIIDKLKSLFGTKSFYGSAVMRNAIGNMSWDKVKYLKVYEISAYVYACVRKRAEKVGEIEFELYGAGGKRIENHNLLNLLYKPNPLMDKSEFFQLWQIYKDLAGIAYIYVLRNGKTPKELHLLRPDWVARVITDKETGLPVQYVYKIPNGKEMLFDANDVIVSAYPSPLEALSGQSPLKAGSLSIDTEEQLSKYHYSVLKNGGKVEGILNFTSENLTKDQIREIREMFVEQYGSSDNAGKPLVTYGGATYQNLGLSPTELSYIESKKMTREDILLLYQVPKTLLGLTDGVQKGNYEESVRMFLSETIRPLLSALTSKLNESLVPENMELYFTDPTPEDIEMELRKVENGIKNYYMTPNEARAVWGLDPIDGGDSLLIPFNLMPSGNYSEDEKEKALKKKEFEHPLKNPEFRTKYYENFLQKADKREKKFLREFRKYIKEQKDRVLSQLNAGTIKQKDIIDDVLNVEVEINIARNLFFPILMEFLQESGSESMALVGSNYDFNVNGRSQALIDKRVDLFTRSITDTTRKKLKTELADSLANSETITELSKRIENVYTGVSKKWSQVIARTETNTAVQTGHFEGYKQAGVEIKIWVHSAGAMGGVREDHQAIDGEERPMDKPFSIGLMYPNDPSADASETINCLCTI